MFAVIVIASGLVAYGYGGEKYLFAEDHELGTLPFNGTVKAAIDLQLATAASLFQATIVILAACWGFVLVKNGSHNRFRLGEPEIASFAFVTLLLLTSMYCYLQYCSDVAGYQANAGKMEKATDQELNRLSQEIPGVKLPAPGPRVVDIFKDRVSYLYQLQVIFLVLGTLSAGLVALSSYFIRPYDADVPANEVEPTPPQAALHA